MICARCLLTGTTAIDGDEKRHLDATKLPAASTVFQGDALCLAHFLTVKNRMVSDAVVHEPWIEVGSERGGFG